MRLTKAVSIVSACLIIVSALPGLLRPAGAQQPDEKRIALVVGNGAYAKSSLATAANDAGLIAQTLQAAGFDVVGARDLDGDTLRKSFRDFVQKAEASGPGTVAMVYLAGYGLQLAGENYFIPVDSAINRDTDIPIEGLRIGDYIRQLAALPLKTSIIVLDAARQQPFIEGGQPIASGLALVEPEANMLIAFNAAPGTIAPAEQGSYGVYAQSLAEMIRTGGLPLPELFNRLRLRVNEASKGAQVPWDAQKVDAPFMFFDRAPDAPVPAAPDQAAAFRDKPIRDLGVQEAYTAALDRDTLQGYEDFLAAYGGDPLAKRVRAIVAARREAITWRRTYRADTPEAYWSYLRRYPRGPHAGDARRRLAILTAPLEPPQNFAMIDYDVPPPPPDEIIYVDRPALMFGDPDFDFAPPPPPPVFFLPPPPPDFVVLEPPPEPEGLFILPQPYFVPIPVYVRPPIYVRPPPNNIIFNNIHNTTIINTVINRPRPGPQPGGPIVGPKGGFGGGAGPKGGAGPNAGPGGVKGPPAGAGGFQPAGGGAGPSLPPAVAQRAALINQGRLPVPPSAAINPRLKPGAPGFQPAQPASGSPGGPSPSVRPSPLPGQVAPGQPPGQVQPQIQPQVPNQGLPKANALPVPGAKGAPPVPPSSTPPSSTPPSPAPPSPAPGFGGPNAVPAQQGRPGGAPGAGPAVVAPSRPGAPAAPPAGNAPPRVGTPPVPAPSRPGFTPPRPAPQAVPRPQIQPQIQRPVPPPRIAPRAAPPPRPAPPPHVAPPPRPAPIARPAPPPPRMAPPPPRMAPPPPRPAPPPMARPAPPPRMAPPPPPPRPAPPPPRPAPPAAKKCPPNVPRC